MLIATKSLTLLVMDKAGLAKKLASASQLSDAEATKFIDSFCATLAENFRQGEKVVIADFGSFFVREDKSVQFNPSAKLKEKIG